MRRPIANAWKDVAGDRFAGSFDKEGVLPVFVVRVQDDTGKVIERKYKLNTPIVRRVLAPGEERPSARSAAKRSSDQAPSER